MADDDRTPPRLASAPASAPALFPNSSASSFSPIASSGAGSVPCAIMVPSLGSRLPWPATWLAMPRIFSRKPGCCAPPAMLLRMVGSAAPSTLPIAPDGSPVSLPMEFNSSGVNDAPSVRSNSRTFVTSSTDRAWCHRAQPVCYSGTRRLA